MASLRGKYEWYAQRVDMLDDDLRTALANRSQDLALLVANLDGRLARLASGLQARPELCAAKLAHLGEALVAALKMRLMSADSALKALDAKLTLLSPYSVLDRGYSLTTDENGIVVRDAAQVPAGARIHTRLQKGELISEVR